MSNLEDRQKAHEQKFAHDAELEFKSIARRNKLLGLWAAEKLGKKGEDASNYAKDVVVTGLETEGKDAIIDRLLADFGRAGVTVPVADIQKHMEHLMPVARLQISEGR